MELRRRIGRIALEAWLPVLLVVAWWRWSVAADSTFFPPLPEILARFQELWLFARFGSDLVPTLTNMAIGYALAGVIGISVGVVLARVRVLRAMAEGLVHFARSVPPIAILPVAILLLGFGDAMRISVIAFSASFATLIATIDGVTSLDPVRRDLVRSYRIPRWTFYRHVLLPQAGPQILAGLRISLLVAFIVMISSEMLASTRGIGYLTIAAQQTFATTDMWAGIVLLGVLGYAINLAFERVERRVLHWQRGTDGST